MIKFRLFNDADIEKISNMFEDQTSSFSELARNLGLDPQTDFQAIDLRGVDFSNSDLRSFNFKGSDLSDTIGVNCQFDETTSFDECNLENSPFAYPMEKKLSLKKSKISKEYNQVMGSDELSRSSYLLNNPNKTVAKMVLHDDESTVTQTSALYAMSSIISSQAEFNNYANSLMNSKYHSIPILKSLQRIISQNFNSEETRRFLFFMLVDKRPEVSVSALRCLSNMRQSGIQDLAEIVLSDIWYDQRRYLCTENGVKYKAFKLTDDKLTDNFAYIAGKKLAPVFIDPVEQLTESTVSEYYFATDEDYMVSFFNNCKRPTLKFKNINQLTRKVDKFLNNENEFNFFERGTQKYLADVFFKSNIKYKMTKQVSSLYNVKNIYSSERVSGNLSVPNLFNTINESSR